MKRAWKEPQLDDLLSDPILDILLAHDRVSRDDLARVLERARQALARVPRQWQRSEQAPVAPFFAVSKCDPRDFAARPG
jgi:hypothetical protein